MTPLPFEPPLPWLWSCHHCHARYPLGATRRCLHDGHYFCGGTTVSELTGKPIKRHKACGSEFDYVGWEDISRWQRRIWDSKLHIGERLRRQNSCEYSCEYPSACHHRGGNSSNRRKSSVQSEDSSVSAGTSVDKTNPQSLVDPSCLETESAARLPKPAEKTSLLAFPSPKSTESLLKKMTKSARRNSRDIALSSVIEHDSLDNTRPIRPASPRPLSSSPAATFKSPEPVGALASAKELGLVIPSLELSTDLPSFFSPDSSSSSSDESFPDETFSESTSPENRSDEDEEAGYPEQLSFKPSKSGNVNNTHHSAKAHHIDLGLDHMSSLPDIDMTDSIPSSPTSPTSPSPPSILAGNDNTNISGGLFTPKSPDSPTNPLFRGKDAQGPDGERTSPGRPFFSRKGLFHVIVDVDEDGDKGKAGTPVKRLSALVKDRAKGIPGLGLHM